jgi:DNA modification methylase
MNRIESLDVLDFMRSIPSNSVDLVIADPPYGIEKDYGVAEAWENSDQWAEWCEQWLVEAQRVLTSQGNLIVYGIHNYLCYNQITLYRLGMFYRRQFIWYYENGFCGHRRLPRATYEPLLWFSKSKKFYFEEIREPYKSEGRLKYAVVKNGKVWQPNPGGRIVGDVWAIPTLAGQRFRLEKVDHPSQKPLTLSERLVRHFAPEGGHVVIPFAGSGSECVAALRNGRTFHATEINPRYRTMAEERLRREDYERNASGAKFVI